MINQHERKGLEKKFYDLCLDVVEQNGLKLYDLDYFTQNDLLRLFIYDEQTLSADIDDCVKIDHALSPHIEELDWMPENLTLEVSSPGIYRRLRTTEQFELSVGLNVELQLMKNSKLLESFKKKKAKLVAKLNACSDTEIKIEFEDKEYNVGLDEIKKAHVAP